MLWFKALHLIFMVTWFAGLFYLPRLFVYHVESVASEEKQRLQIMQRRLFAIMSIGGVLTLIFGLLLLWVAPFWLEHGWMQLKLILLAGLWAFHLHGLRVMRQLALGQNQRSSRWYRLYNEVPGLFLVAIVLLAVIKPF